MGCSPMGPLPAPNPSWEAVFLWQELQESVNDNWLFSQAQGSNNTRKINWEVNC